MIAHSCDQMGEAHLFMPATAARQQSRQHRPLGSSSTVSPKYQDIHIEWKLIDTRRPLAQG